VKKSLLQSSKECYITKVNEGLHRHHIFYGTGNRKNSDRYGLWVWLIPRLHNIGTGSIHGGNWKLDLKLKREAQTAFEEKYSHDKFMQVFGENYL